MEMIYASHNFALYNAIAELEEQPLYSKFHPHLMVEHSLSMTDLTHVTSFLRWAPTPPMAFHQIQCEPRQAHENRMLPSFSMGALNSMPNDMARVASSAPS